MPLREAFRFPQLSLRDRFLLQYARLSDPPVRWLAGGGGDPDTTAPTGVPGGDFSVSGRGALAAALDDPTSLTNIALDAMGLLGGPIGSLAIGAGRTAMAAHNAAALNAAITGVGKGESILSQIAKEGLRVGVPPSAPPGLAESPVGLTAEDVDVATEAEQGETGEGDAGPGVGGGAPFRRGGVVRDRMLRPDDEEVIRAHEGEFVVRAGAAKKHRRLLHAINAGRPTHELRALVTHGR